MCFVFFFQAEDGIRDHCVTGVQTCALPISLGGSPAWRTLLVTSSLATSRTSSSFSGSKPPSNRSREWRAAKPASELGVSLRSISAFIKKPQRIDQHCKRYVPSVTRGYTLHRSVRLCSIGERRDKYARLVTSTGKR